MKPIVKYELKPCPFAAKELIYILIVREQPCLLNVMFVVPEQEILFPYRTM